jgi:hypothetical protein
MTSYEAQGNSTRVAQCLGASCYPRLLETCWLPNHLCSSTATIMLLARAILLAQVSSPTGST